MSALRNGTWHEAPHQMQTLKILFGSQGGNAEDAAFRFQRQARSRRFAHASCMAIDDYPFASLVHEQYPLLFVCSTTGQGEMPDNMRKFWTFICRRDLPNDALATLKFAVVALGDSSYRQFNFAGKKLSRRLKQLGAWEFCPIALADDQHELGPDAAIEAFECDFWRVLRSTQKEQADQDEPDERNGFDSPSVMPELRYICNNTVRLTDSEPTSDAKSYGRHFDADLRVDAQNPYPARCLENVRLTPDDYFKDFRLIRLSCDSSLPSLAYVPGDVVMIQPQNSRDAVDDFLTNVLSHIASTQRVEIVCRNADFKPPPEYVLPRTRQCSVQELARFYWDFQSVPRRSFFAVAQYFTPSERERERLAELASPAGLDDLYAYCFRVRRTVAEVLQDFRELSGALTLEQLMELIPPLRPRAFSIASSMSSHRNELHLLLSVVHYKTKLHRPRVGVCSSWLAGLRVGDTVLCWLRGGSIKFPPAVAEQPQQPCIMIGPGSGVAPFRSFINERAHQTVKQNFLFFGNRNRDKDFLFQHEWRELCDRGMLHLVEPPAFSRDQEDKVYVQHRLRENAELVYRLMMKENAVLVMAGNAKMPAQVMDGLSEILQTHGGMNEAEALLMLAAWEKQRRIQSETWS